MTKLEFLQKEANRRSLGLAELEKQIVQLQARVAELRLEIQTIRLFNVEPVETPQEPQA